MDNMEKVNPALGHLTYDPRVKGWETTIEILPGTPVCICVSLDGLKPEDTNMDELFHRAEAYLSWARTAEPECRARAAYDLLEDFNTHWSDDDPNEGHRRVSREEFVQAIQLERVTLYPTGEADWCYKANELFGGHGLSVWASADRKFVRAEIFG